MDEDFIRKEDAFLEREDALDEQEQYLIRKGGMLSQREAAL